jgi:hypothetical protein
VEKQKAAGVYANPTHCRMRLQFSIRNVGSNNISFTREISLDFREIKWESIWKDSLQPETTCSMFDDPWMEKLVAPNSLYRTWHWPLLSNFGM